MIKWWWSLLTPTSAVGQTLLTCTSALDKGSFDLHVLQDSDLFPNLTSKSKDDATRSQRASCGLTGGGSSRIRECKTMPLQKRPANKPLGPPGTNGRRLKTDEEKRKTREKTAQKERDLARQAHSQCQLGKFTVKYQSRQVSSQCQPTQVHS